MRAEHSEDPFTELAAAACNLMGDSIGVHLTGFVAADTGELCAASSAFAGLSAVLRSRTTAAVVATVNRSTFDDEKAHSSQLISVEVPPEVGEHAAALLFPETEIIVFAVPQAGRSIATDTLRRVAISVLPIIYRAGELRAERVKLTTENALLSHVQEVTKIGGWEQVVGSGRLVWTDEIYTIHGLEPGSELTLERVLKLYPSPAREQLSMEMERAVAEGGGFELTTPIRTPFGDKRIVRTVGRTNMGRDGRRLYGTAQDVTRELSTERRMWWAANHDPVTSLPNRLLFEDRIGVATRRARREDRRFALLIIEISDFARLMQHSGYTVPDKHMLEVAARLGSITRESDTIARISINEFALILSDVDSAETFAPAMTRLKEEFAQMLTEQAGGDGIVVSAGAAFFPAHASNPEDLTRAAEMALSRAKRKLDTPVIIFDREIADDDARRRETILTRARQSLDKREFVPYYQPQFDMDTGEVIGVEALVRWQTPDLTLDAKEFAYALDDHEIGSSVGRLVLDTVIADVAKLREVADLPFRVSVNASRTEVLRNDFLETFLKKISDGNLRPTDFIIEITEDVIIGVDDRTLHNKVSFLASSGVEFSLDDFGTGYASLIHITTFPVKEIKIDKQFIFGIETDRRKRAIVHGILQIAQSMGLNVIAEGVETAEQREVLRELGARYAQGYLYSFPLPFEEFAALLKQPA